MVAAAVIGSAVVGVGTSVAASSANKKAINKSTAAQTAANDKALAASTSALDKSLALQKQTYETGYGALQPYANLGGVAGPAYMGLLGYDVPGGASADAAYAKYKNSTGYEARLDEGLDAVNSKWAGRGMVQSGAAMKDIARYGQDYASNEFGKYVGYVGNALDTGYRAATGQAQVGQNYATGTSALYNDYAKAVGGNAVANGQAASDAAIAKANNTNTMLGGWGAP